jgi:hypothetical protein
VPKMGWNAQRITSGDKRRRGLVARFTAEDGAQDLVEYALLAAFIGIAGWAVLMLDGPCGRCAVAMGSAGASVRWLVAGGATTVYFEH